MTFSGLIIIDIEMFDNAIISVERMADFGIFISVKNITKQRIYQKHC